MAARITAVPPALLSCARGFGHAPRMNTSRAGEFYECARCGSRIELDGSVWGGAMVGWSCDEVAAGLAEGIVR